MLRVAGIVALFVLTACGQATAAPSSPSPVIAAGNWTQNLTFKGDVNGHMTAIVADTDTQQSACTGSKTRDGETWSDTFFGTVDSSGQQWEVVFLIGNFRGPGTYTNSDVNVQLQAPDNTKAWLNLDGERVTFVVERGQQSGTIDAYLTNATTGKTDAEHVTGRWNCRG